MKIVVTGANGLIGYSCCELLSLKRNHTIIGLLYSPNSELVPWLVQEADLTKPQSLKILKELQPNFIVHCAALFPNGVNDVSFEKAAEQNSLIDNNIIRYCQENEIPLIFISSTSVYEATNNIIKESSKTNPPNAYSVQKLKSEQIIQQTLKSYQILRINSPYGPRQSARNVLRIFIDRALKDEGIQYFGTGSRTQEFIHTSDVATAVLKSIDKMNNEIYNISSGLPISMKHLAEQIVDLVPHTKSEVSKSKNDDPLNNSRIQFDITKAKADLDWSPLITLTEGIQDWIKTIAT